MAGIGIRSTRCRTRQPCEKIFDPLVTTPFHFCRRLTGAAMAFDTIDELCDPEQRTTAHTGININVYHQHLWHGVLIDSATVGYPDLDIGIIFIGKRLVLSGLCQHIRSGFATVWLLGGFCISLGGSDSCIFIRTNASRQGTGLMRKRNLYLICRVEQPNVLESASPSR